MSITQCTCVIPEGNATIVCDRHKCTKNAHLVRLCQNHPGYFKLWEEGRGPGQITPNSGKPSATHLESRIPQSKQYLGDKLASALASVGVTPEKVSDWLGVECGCVERRQKLNQLHSWAERVLKGAKEKAQEYLEDILKQ